MQWQNIVVSSKILGHISAGIYRTTAGALKELISNAYDADSSRVAITTNSPSFDIITCSDNGNGITPDEFSRMMEGGIGDSQKRVEGDSTAIYNRPIIGQLGIGILGIAQICHEFKIISHHKGTETAFEANIVLMDYLKEKVSGLELDKETDQAIDVGKFNYNRIDYDAELGGTQIIAADMRTAFVRRFRENANLLLPSLFSSFLENIHDSGGSIKELGAYWQMVWELTVASPVPYPESGPFNWDNIDLAHEGNFKDDFELLKKSHVDSKFEVIVDGLSLKKPNVFPYPTNRTISESIKGVIFPINNSFEVYGKPLKIMGYIYLQDGKAIEPAELRGILIRIKKIAIGYYDSTFLKYPKIEGPRFNWLSGELFVLEGLEHALNIDRDSFNEMHPHYIKIQQIVHDLLPSVFRKASIGVNERSARKRIAAESAHSKRIISIINESLGGTYDVVEKNDDGLLIEIDKKQQQIILNTGSDYWPKKKAQRDLTKIAAIAYEISAIAEKSARRDTFYKLLNKLLSI